MTRPNPPAFLAAALIAAIFAGCGGGGSAGSTQTRVVSSAGTTHTHTVTVARPAHAPTTVPVPTSATRVPAAVGGHLLRSYSGAGNTRLGTIVVRSPSVLVWSAHHPPIQIFTSRGFMLVDSEEPNGVIQLSRGTYRTVHVASRADWSIELRSH